jgi:hypothetical protein
LQCNENSSRAFLQVEAQKYRSEGRQQQHLAPKECQMNTKFANRPDAAIVERISRIHMFEGRRRAAIGAMSDAFAFVDGYTRVADSVKHALRRLSFRPRLGH